MNVHETSAAIRDGVTRAVAIIALAGIALIHLLDVSGKLKETPYIGWMYIGLIAACIVVGAALIASSSRKAWTATAALSLAVLVGFVLSRTTGLPSATGDIGNWGEPLGIASMFVESALFVLSVSVLATRVNEPATRAAAPARTTARTTSREFAEVA